MGKIVLCGSVRTPIGAFLGTLSDISTVELGTICAQESIRRAKVPLDQVDEVIIGHVLAATQGKFIYSSFSSSSGKNDRGGGSVLKKFCQFWFSFYLAEDSRTILSAGMGVRG